MANLLQPTGSLINNIAANSAQRTPEVGMGATMLYYTDRHAATIVEVKSPRRIVLQEDTATRIDKNGMSEDQDYSYTTNPNGGTKEFTLRKNGRWVAKGDSAKSGLCCHIGSRGTYYDFSF
jgi:hypothetical protein